MTLSATAITLFALIGWSIVLLFLLAGFRALKVMGHKKAINSFSADGKDLPGFGQRLTRAHANCLENLPLQASLLLYAIATQQTAVTDPLAYTLLFARLFQSCMHLRSSEPLFIWLRFAGFLLQILILVSWLLQFCGWR
jgi:uncharacterized MAPEG superfamily protein